MSKPEIRTEYGVRLRWDDGHTEDQPCVSRGFAQQRIDHHTRARVDQPGWKVTAELIQRTITTSPWTAAQEQS